MSDSDPSNDIRCVSILHATGSDIPEELFEDILRNVEDPVYPAIGEEGGHAPAKNSAIHFLASLNLVCKYFAKICRPKLYEVLSMRTDRQLRGLLGLLESGCAPFGVPLLNFTTYFHIKPHKGDTPWIHRIPTILLPKMKAAGLKPIDNITLTMDGLEPVRVLPRTLPSSFFLHITGLELESVHFRNAKELFRSVFFLRSLECVTLLSCTLACDAILPRLAFPHIPRSPKWASIILQNSRTIMPIMISEMLDSYAQHRSITFLSCGQTEAQTLGDIAMTLYDHQVVSTSEKCCILSALDDEWLAINMDITNDNPAGAREHFLGLDLWFQHQTLTYDVVVHTFKSPTRDASTEVIPFTDAWRTLASCIARLAHLNMLKLGFTSFELMESFVTTVRPILQGLHATEKKIELGVYPNRWCKPAKFEPLSAVLERFAPAVEMEHISKDSADEAAVEGNRSSAITSLAKEENNGSVK